VRAYSGPRARAHIAGAPWTDRETENAILADLRAPGRTEGVRKIAARHGVSVGTVQRISRPFEASVAVAA
jgi:hypothetical protein